MSFIEAFLNVLAILGIIVAGGFLVFFLGDLVLSILEPRRRTIIDKEKSYNKESYNNKESYKEEKSYISENNESNKFSLEDEPSQISPTSEISEEKFVMDDTDFESVDFDKAHEEKESLKSALSKEFSSPQQKEKKSDDLNDLFNEDKDFNFGDDFDFDSFFNDKKEEPIKEEPAKQPVQLSTQNEETEDYFSNIVENSAPVTSAVASTPDVKEIIKEVYVDNHEREDELRVEIEELRRELEEQRALYEELKKQARNNEEKWEMEKTEIEKLYVECENHEQEKSVPLLTLAEYELRLETLRNRLKANEKELKANKKEFIPLKRVRKNLDKDKDKLRRREALVAKQKVMLYGVNNIMEIDQEKAKKLAEDLDLLDGLKVSVRHCEEVMESNKDRYPILETTNRILITTNQELKADIAECEKAVMELKIANGTADDDGQELIITASQTMNKKESEEVLVGANGEEIPQKRKRGRPRKVQGEDTATSQETVDTISSIIEEEDNFSHTSLFETIEEDNFSKAQKQSFSFDNDEPSFEDLFAIQDEENDTDKNN